jgi:hypothetical protein
MQTGCTGVVAASVSVISGLTRQYAIGCESEAAIARTHFPVVSHPKKPGSPSARLGGSPRWNNFSVLRAVTSLRLACIPFHQAQPTRNMEQTVLLTRVSAYT